jgi:lipoprotein-releasing system ATP-binding protein
MMVLEAVDLGKEYRGGDGGTITVLDGVNLRVARGEMLAVVGASGAGKSTLLHLLGALDEPTRGEVFINGIRLPGSRARAGSDVSSERDSSSSGGGVERFRERRVRRRLAGKRDLEVSALRNRSVGFVFQFHHLLREFTALENVAMPLRIAGWDEARAQKRAGELLERVGLGARMQHRPSELSGGEQQRSAVARALAIDPAVVLADEPSGNLDHMTSERLHDLFVELSRDLEIAMVIATHNRSLAARADRTLLLEDGHLTPTDVREVVP